MTNIDKIQKIIEKNNGVLFTAELTKMNIPRFYLAKLVDQGKIERVNRGIYVSSSEIDDEMYYMQVKYPKIIYSHETALYMHGLSDRTPFEYSLTVPSNYKVMKNISSNNKVYYIKSDLHSLGAITAPTSFGNNVVLYNIERTICDIVRSRNKIDVQIFNDALRRYSVLKTSDLILLGEYAKKFNVEKVLKQYMEVLL